MLASLRPPVSHAPETFSGLLRAHNEHCVFPSDAVVLPVGLLISPDVSLFIFNYLDSSEKCVIQLGHRSSWRTECGHENAWVRTWEWVGFFYELNTYILKTLNVGIFIGDF